MLPNIDQGIKKDISVIIPCYNTNPKHLQEAIDSVKAYKGENIYEIIIVDDGSKNELTLDWLKTKKNQGINVFYQENKGPAAARNTGANNCNADYILFLDSDNKVLHEYIDECIDVLKTNTKVGVVYGNPIFFGASKTPRFKSGPFDIKKILLENYIDTCSIVRRTAWKDIGGFDEDRVLIGHEDWEFWINLHANGWQLFYINKSLFYYRISNNSLVTDTGKEDFYNKLRYVYQKHWKVVYENYLHLYGQYLTYKDDMKRPLRSFIKYIKEGI